jgi:hypothetical protein
MGYTVGEGYKFEELKKKIELVNALDVDKKLVQDIADNIKGTYIVCWAYYIYVRVLPFDQTLLNSEVKQYQ